MFCPDGVVDIPKACGAKSAESLQPGFESRSGRFSIELFLNVISRCLLREYAVVLPKDLITLANKIQISCAANRGAIRVRERLVVALQSSKFPRSKSGIPGYDELVDGGYHKGTVNTITGSSGTGKTVFAGQFINYGIKMGEN